MLKKIAIKIIILFVILMCIMSTFSNAALTTLQQNALKNYTEEFIRVGQEKGFLEYTTESSTALQKGYNLELYEGKLYYCCVSFINTMYHQVFGIEGLNSSFYTSFYNPKGDGKDFFEFVPDNEELQIGDILVYEGFGIHAMMYIGKDGEGNPLMAETGGDKCLIIRKMQTKSSTTITSTKVGDIKQCISNTSDNAGKKIFGEVVRMKSSKMIGTKINTRIAWPDGTYTYYKTPTGNNTQIGITERGTGNEKQYEGIYQGLPKEIDYLGSKSGILEWIGNFLADFIDYATGFILLIVKAAVVGWTRVAENTFTAVVQFVSNTKIENAVTVEDIVYNKVPLLDVNIFNYGSASNQAIQKEGEIGTTGAQDKDPGYYQPTTETEEAILKGDDVLDEEDNGLDLGSIYAEGLTPQASEGAGINVIYTIRKTIALWYYALRNIAIIGLLITLIYIGIRIAISTIGEDRAKYKKLLSSWFVSFVIVFFIHYFMIIVININEFFVGLLSNSGGSQSLYMQFRVMAYDMKLSTGWTGTILYMLLVYYLLKYGYMYIKRFFTICILCILAPLIGISYSIDKIKSNKSQSLNRWMSDFAISVLIQTIHAMIYTIFVSLAFGIVTSTNFFGAILAFVFLNFMASAEKLVRKMFKFESSSSLKYILDDAANVLAGGYAVYHFGKSYLGLSYRAIRGAGGLAGRTPIVKKPLNFVKGKVESTKTYNDVQEELYGKADSGKSLGNIDAVIRKKKMENKEKRRAYAKSQINAGKALITGAAQLMIAIPMAITSPKKAFGFATRSMDTFTRIFPEKRAIAGYQKKKGNIIFKMATAGANVAMLRQYSNMNKTRKELTTDYMEEIQLLNEARNIGIKVVQEAEMLAQADDLALRQSDDEVEKALIVARKETLDKYISQALATIPDNLVEKAVLSYMQKKGSNQIGVNDIDGIVKELSKITGTEITEDRMIEYIKKEIENGGIQEAMLQILEQKKVLTRDEITQLEKERDRNKVGGRKDTKGEKNDAKDAIEEKVEVSLYKYRKENDSEPKPVDVVQDVLRNYIEIPEDLKEHETDVRQLVQTIAEEKLKGPNRNDEGSYSAIDRNRFVQKVKEITGKDDVLDIPVYTSKTQLHERDITHLEDLLRSEEKESQIIRENVTKVIEDTIVEDTRRSLGTEEIIQLIQRTVKGREVFRQIEVSNEYEAFIREVEKMVAINEKTEKMLGQQAYPEPEKLIEKMLNSVKFKYQKERQEEPV